MTASEEAEVLHTISFPIDNYFNSTEMNLGQMYEQRVTMFDDVDDDDYDGVFGENDPDEPYILTQFTLSEFTYEAIASSPKSPRRARNTRSKYPFINSDNLIESVGGTPVKNELESPDLESRKVSTQKDSPQKESL
jgi:hypothetical protein